MFFYEDVFRALNKAKVRYVVFGGIAAILYGVPRTTIDLDIVVDMKPTNIEKLFNTLDDLGYKPRLPITVEQFKDKKLRHIWYKQKNMKVFSFFNVNDYKKIIDIAIEDLIKYEDIKRKIVKSGNVEVPLISIEQLVMLKKKAGRQQDLIDLDDLQRLRRIQK